MGGVPTVRGSLGQNLSLFNPGSGRLTPIQAADPLETPSCKKLSVPTAASGWLLHTKMGSGVPPSTSTCPPALASQLPTSPTLPSQTALYRDLVKPQLFANTREAQTSWKHQGLSVWHGVDTCPAHMLSAAFCQTCAAKRAASSFLSPLLYSPAPGPESH